MEASNGVGSVKMDQARQTRDMPQQHRSKLSVSITLSGDKTKAAMAARRRAETMPSRIVLAGCTPEVAKVPKARYCKALRSRRASKSLITPRKVLISTTASQKMVSTSNRPRPSKQRRIPAPSRLRRLQTVRGRPAPRSQTRHLTC